MFFAMMVMPRSRSRSMESIMRSYTSARSARVSDWRKSWSTRVVLPWSTWATMAMLRIFLTSWISVTVHLVVFCFLGIKNAAWRGVVWRELYARAAYWASFSCKSAFTVFGLAWPCERFSTWPVRKPSIFVCPSR